MSAAKKYRVVGSRVVVCGGAGCIGSHVVERLLRDCAAHVTVVDDLSEGNYENVQALERQFPGRFTFEALDLVDLDRLRRCITDEYDYVFHLAGHLLLKSQADPVAAVQANVVATVNVLEASLRAGIRKLVFTSSISIFGEPDYTPVDENHPLNNVTSYGATKLCGEHLCRDYARRGLPYAIVRPYNVYGSRQSPRNGAFSQVVPRWIRRVLQGHPIVIHGDGSQTMDLVHAADMASAHVLALESGAADGEAFNIGTGVATSATELAEQIRCQMEVPDHPIEYVPHDVNLVKNRRCDIRKAQRILGYAPFYSLESGLRETIDWWRSKP